MSSGATDDLLGLFLPAGSRGVGGSWRLVLRESNDGRVPVQLHGVTRAFAEAALVAYLRERRAFPQAGERDAVIVLLGPVDA